MAKRLEAQVQEAQAQLSQTDRATRYGNLVNCCTAVRKIIFGRLTVDLKG